MEEKVKTVQRSAEIKAENERDRERERESKNNIFKRKRLLMNLADGL